MVIRTFLCRRCRFEADYSVDNPRCQKCGATRMQWIPGGGHPQKQLRRNDSIMRGLAETYGLTNMKTAREGECVMPNPEPTKPYDGPPLQLASGVNVPLQMNGRGQVVASCQPIEVTGAMLDAVGPTTALPKAPSLAERTIVEARYTGPPGDAA